MEKYPFSFILTLSYKITDGTVNVGWQVENPNDSKMYFSIGGHPAFNCDLDTWTLRFEKAGKVNDTVTAFIISSDGSGCLGDEKEKLALDNGILHMSDELFSRDALIIEDRQSDQVTLVNPEGVDQPWYGRCDRVGFNQKLEEREYGNTLEAGEVFKTSYDIICK